MKLLYLALLATTPTLLPTPAKADTHTSWVRFASETQSSTHPIQSHVTAAIEPASFLLVGFGLLGGGALRRRSLLEARKGQ